MADLVIDNTIEAIVLPNGEELELGKKPSGNIDITQAGVTDVSEYATATVPQGQISVYIGSGEFYTESNVLKWRIRAGGGVDTLEGEGTPGFITDQTWVNSNYRNFNAIPSNTTVTPTESAQTIGGADTMMKAAVTVDAIPSNYVGTGITRRSSTDLTASGATVSVPSGFYENNASKAVASGTEGTPTATKGTVSNHAVSVTPSVTNSAGYISGGTHTGTAVSVSASELVSGTINITSSGNTDVTNYATASVASGSATASATKGTVSNHSVTVTPSVTRTAGYVTAGTASGTAVTVSASELVSGSQTITENGTVDVTNLAEVVVAVEGGGGGSSSIDTKTLTNSSASNKSISFTGLSGTPIAFFVRCTSQLTRSSSSSYYYVTAVRYNGTNHYGNYWRMSNGTFYNDTTHYSHTYSNGTLTISSSGSRSAAGGSFYNGSYELVYIY